MISSMRGFCSRLFICSSICASILNHLMIGSALDLSAFFLEK